MKKAGLKAAAAAAAAWLILQGGPSAFSQSCTEYTASYAESLASLVHMDTAASSVKFWCTDGTSPSDIVTLNKVGANFTFTNPAAMPTWVNCATAADFDNDGWPDFVGTSSSYSNCLVFIRNMGGAGQVGSFQVAQWIDGSQPSGSSNWPGLGVGGAALDNEGHCAITAGDYDGDGDIDFLYVCSTTASGFAFKRIWLYKNTLINNGVNTGTVGFQQVDLTSALSGTLQGIAWTGTTVTSADIDNDGDVDVMFGTKSGKVFQLTNTGNGAISASTFFLQTTPAITTGWGGRGVTTVSSGDFRRAGVPDLIVGSVSTNTLQHYANDGSGHFSLYQTITYNGAATVTLTGDYDLNGTQDLMIGTDNWNYPANTGAATGYGGKAILLRNMGAAVFTQTMVFSGLGASPSVSDFDMGAALDYNKDGIVDFIMSDSNNSHYYCLFRNGLASVYNTQGLAISGTLTPTLSGGNYAITKARISGLTQRTSTGSATGLDIAYYLSNDDGKTWAYYVEFNGTAIVNAGAQTWLSFTTYGTKLRWLAILSAANDSIAGYDLASNETPILDAVSLDYVYVDRREYSRTSAAAEVIVSDQWRELIVSATFMYPGSEGHLRAYDVTGIKVNTAANSTIQTITAPIAGTTGRSVASGGSILWDAADLLNARTADSRTIYAGYRAGSGAALQRIDFTTANVSTLAPLLLDTDGDNAGLINFVRGQGRTAKLGDIQHSTPVIVGPPSGSTAVYGAGYDEFAAAHTDRNQVIFVGANDGMLHCFDADTGDELWGFIPYNLVPMLKNMSKKGSVTKTRYFSPASYVDGTPSVGDAYVNGAWKTVLMCGQGPGKGSTVGGGTNYYFALDVTDPANPIPLWEFTDASMGETWSVPAFGQITAGWLAFMGSGYNNDATKTMGNHFYIIRLNDGTLMQDLSVNNVNSAAKQRPKPFPDIYVSIPGSPTAIDSINTVMTDYVYFGDLDGRLYRLNLTTRNLNNLRMTAIYTDNNNYPIITKPAIFTDPLVGNIPMHIYFGTGGDDNAPATGNYAFLALSDTGSSATVEWYLGNSTDLNLGATLSKGSFDTGEKAWADPVISDYIIYFSTLKGSIENVNPCLNLADVGKLYARYVRSIAGGIMGATALKTVGSAPLESMQLASKARRAVTIGERTKVPDTYKREVYIQEYDSTIERLEQPTGAYLKIISWREISKIYK